MVNVSVCMVPVPASAAKRGCRRSGRPFHAFELPARNVRALSGTP